MLLYYLKVLCTLVIFGILFWVLSILIMVEPKTVVDFFENYTLTNQDDREYICSIDGIERCQTGDWIYVPLQQVATYCHEEYLRGGILLNREVSPLFIGDDHPQSVLCLYRGKPRERR